MNKQEIELAREWLELPDSATDEEIADGLHKSLVEAQIRMHLALDELGQAFADCVKPIKNAVNILAKLVQKE